MSAKNKAQAASLEKRIRHFYELLNERSFAECYRMIDPVVRDKASSVTLYQYENSLRAFLDHYRQIQVCGLQFDLHLEEASTLYNDRDFAVGQTTWKDEAGAEHQFQERWVRDGRSWYTRSTGLVAPQPLKGAGAAQDALHSQTLNEPVPKRPAGLAKSVRKD